MNSPKYILAVFVVISIFGACQEELVVPTSQFSKLNPSKSGVDFENTLSFNKEFNIYTYRNYYNGGGVGLSDVNNDGLVDIYFTANMLPNKLYINKGALKFEEVTEKAGVSGNKSWSTGVSMADINGDGWVDIYVCNSGDISGDNRQNELFINNGDGTFSEKALEYGLADQGLSTHAAFFDFDNDGDLDVYLLNNSFQAIGSFNLTKNQRPIRNEKGGDKLFRNDGGVFKDISEQAGIYGSVIGFGLGVTVGDIDLDGWIDIYVSNDFFERDYIYMNNGDGTFTENLEEQMKSISGASMGADIADINNDGYPDIFVTEMLPEPNDRLKTKTTFENWDRYQVNVENGYYHQFTRNMLQLNNGNNSFSEIGRMAGVEATDWSWGALINDYDNDGLKDLFIANGIYKDLTDQDYINYIGTREIAMQMIKKDGVDYKKLTEVIPSSKIPNYMYRNTNGMQYENVTKDWGLDEPSHSNGSAYGDLDNDGDLDLVINNSNALASIYINHLESLGSNNYLKVILKGDRENSQAIGTKIRVYKNGNFLYQEQVPVRGFQSSVDPRPHFGLSDYSEVDSVIVIWNDGSKTSLKNVSTNQTITIDKKDQNSDLSVKNELTKDVVFTNTTEKSGLEFLHEENAFVDFNRDRLLYHMLSVEGPAICKGDFNGDHLEDVFIGGASEQAGKVFLQKQSGAFSPGDNRIFIEDQLSEDVDCACLDVDGDGDLDMYVASGGNEFSNNSSALIDRLYINNGSGKFKKSNQILPSFKFENTSCVSPSDYDGDGDIDLFVGARAKPFLIGVPVDGFLLENDGKGNFTDVSKTIAPSLKSIGMITDATWSDVDNDKDLDLLIVGEWMGIKLFRNNDGHFEDVSSQMGLQNTHGWWNSISASDLDGDGDVDFVAGNHGLNSRFTATAETPVQMYLNDFDQNGSAEPIICVYFEDNSYPLVLKHDLISQLPSLRKKYVEYNLYKDQTINDIFTPEQLEKAIVLKATTLTSSIILNNGEQGFEIKALPLEAQLSPVYDISIHDFDRDGNDDLLLGGNFYNSKPEVGIYDASFTTFLKGDGIGNFYYVPNNSIGLKIKEQIRGFAILQSSQKNQLIVARNNASTQVYTF